MTQCEKQRYVKRLAQFKKDYNFTSKEIAQELETTEAAVSHWFNNDSLPQLEKIKKMDKLFHKYCIPGIIKIPKNKYWSDAFFLRVGDIKNPYASWYNDEQSGEEPEIFSKWVSEWSLQFLNPEIIYTFAANPDYFETVSIILTTSNLNNVVNFQDYFIGQPDLETVFQTHPGLNPSGFDHNWANKLISGEWDGTT